MPPAIGPALVDFDLMAEAAQLVGGRQARRSGADHEHPLAAFGGRRRKAPAALDGLVAQETLDRIDPDRGIELRPVASGFARVIADPAHHRR